MALDDVIIKNIAQRLDKWVLQNFHSHCTPADCQQWGEDYAQALLAKEFISPLDLPKVRNELSYEGVEATLAHTYLMSYYLIKELADPQSPVQAEIAKIPQALRQASVDPLIQFMRSNFLALIEGIHKIGANPSKITHEQINQVYRQTYTSLDEVLRIYERSSRLNNCVNEISRLTESISPEELQAENELQEIRTEVFRKSYTKIYGPVFSPNPLA